MPLTTLVSSRDGEKLPVLAVRPIKTEAARADIQPIGLCHPQAPIDNYTTVSNPMAMNEKIRSANGDTEQVRYYQHVEMFDGGQVQSYVLPEIMETGRETQQCASGEPDRSWQTVPQAYVGYSEHPRGQQTTAVIYSSEPRNENGSMEYYSGPGPQHVQGNPIVEFPHRRSKGESGYYTGAHRYNYNQEMQDFAQFQLGNPSHHNKSSNFGLEIPLDNTHSSCDSQPGLPYANPRYERFETYGERSCNSTTFGQQSKEIFKGFSANDSEVQLASCPRPSVPFGGHLVAKRTLFGLENDSDAGIPESFVFCGPVTPEKVDSFHKSTIKSACNLANLKSSKQYVPIDSPENVFDVCEHVYGEGLCRSPGRPIATKTRLVPSKLKQIAVKGRKSAIIKCNINAKRSGVRKVDDDDVTQRFEKKESTRLRTRADSKDSSAIGKSVEFVAQHSLKTNYKSTIPETCKTSAIQDFNQVTPNSSFIVTAKKKDELKRKLIKAVAQSSVKQDQITGASGTKSKTPTTASHTSRRSQLLWKKCSNSSFPITEKNTEDACRKLIENVVHSNSQQNQTSVSNECTQVVRKETPKYKFTETKNTANLKCKVLSNLKQNLEVFKADKSKTQTCSRKLTQRLTAKSTGELRRKLIKYVASHNSMNQACTVTTSRATKPETQTSASHECTHALQKSFTETENTDELKRTAFNNLKHNQAHKAAKPETQTSAIHSNLIHTAIKTRKLKHRLIEYDARSNLKPDQESKVTQPDRPASACLESRHGHTQVIRQKGARGPNTIIFFSGSNKATLIKRTSLDNLNAVHQESDRPESQSSNATYPRPNVQEYLTSYPGTHAKTLRGEQQEEKSGFTESEVIVTDDTGLLTMEQSHEDPIPNHIKHRMKCRGKLEQVVSRLKAVGQGSSEANVIDLTTECSETDASFSWSNNEANGKDSGMLENENKALPNYQDTPSSPCGQDEQVALQDFSSALTVLAPKDSNKDPIKRSHLDAFGRIQSNANGKVLTDFILKQTNCPKQGRGMKQAPTDRSGVEFGSVLFCYDENVVRSMPQSDQQSKGRKLEDVRVIEDTPGVNFIIHGGRVTRVGNTKPKSTAMGVGNKKLRLSDREESKGSWKGSWNTSVPNKNVDMNSAGEFSVNNQRVENITPQLDPEGQSDYLMLRSSDQMYFFSTIDDKAYVLPLPEKNKNSAALACLAKILDTHKTQVRYPPISSALEYGEETLAIENAQVLAKCKLANEGVPIISTTTVMTVDEKENIIAKSVQNASILSNEKYSSLPETVARERNTSKSHQGKSSDADDCNVAVSTMMCSPIRMGKAKEFDERYHIPIRICPRTATNDDCCSKPSVAALSCTWSESACRQDPWDSDAKSKSSDCQPKIDIVPTGFRIRTNPDCDTCKKFLLKIEEAHIGKQRLTLMQDHATTVAENLLPIERNSVLKQEASETVENGGEKALSQEQASGKFVMKPEPATDDAPDNTGDQGVNNTYSHSTSYPSAGENRPMTVKEEITIDIRENTIKNETPKTQGSVGQLADGIYEHWGTIARGDSDVLCTDMPTSAGKHGRRSSEFDANITDEGSSKDDGMEIPVDINENLTKVDHATMEACPTTTHEIRFPTNTVEDREQKIRRLRELLRCTEEKILMSRQIDPMATVRLMEDFDDL